MNKDDMSDDAEFDAFLSGQGDLARRLQGLAQPAPSAALDAAILASARAAMAQETRPVAANDSGEAGLGVPGLGVPRLAPGLGWRWRVPAGIAAAVLVGVFAKQAYEASSDAQRVVVPAPAEDAVMAPVAAVPAPVIPAPAAKAAADERPLAARAEGTMMPAPEPALARAKKPAARARLEGAMTPPVAMSESRAPSPASGIVFEPAAPSPPPPPAPAPVVVTESAAPALQDKMAPRPLAEQADSAKALGNELSRSAPRTPPTRHYSASSAQLADHRAAADGASKESSKVTVTGRRNMRTEASNNAGVTRAAPDLARPVAAAPPAPVGVMAEHEWLDRIKKLLAQGRQTEAVADWKAFREVYPNYPVPEETRSKLE